ncbi:MAG: hypothetical protein H6739_30900 [Alphaproteobacteria bacterium]|nr:hypothetical protein [Alphaproteobacteria bacterium]
MSLMTLLWIALAPDAGACSPSPCSGGFVVPGEGATVPANLPALLWSPRRGSSGPDGEPTLTAEAGAALPLTLERADGLLVLRAEGLAPGGYTLNTPAHCPHVYGERDRDHTLRRFTVGPAAPLPDALGSLRATPGFQPVLEVSTGGGSCSLEVPAATIEVVLEPDPSAMPWMEALLFTTLVDGEPWFSAHDLNAEYAPGASWTGRGRDLLFTACGEQGQWADGSLPPGAHEVQLQARLAGHDAAWSTPKRRFELRCPDKLPVPADETPSRERWAGCGSGPARGGGVLVLVVMAALGRRRRGGTAQR